jgi:hypothetical protein
LTVSYVTFNSGHENGNYTYMKQLLLFGALMISVNMYSQKAERHCCTIIDMARDAGTFTIRDINTGRIALFKPDALEGAELKVGDSVDVMFELRRVASVKDTATTYDLMDAARGDSCCVILKLDSALSESSWRVTAKNSSTGENIYFNVPKSLAARLNAGGIVYTQASHGYAMIAAADADTTKKQLYGFPLLQESSK